MRISSQAASGDDDDDGDGDVEGDADKDGKNEDAADEYDGDVIEEEDDDVNVVDEEKKKAIATSTTTTGVGSEVISSDEAVKIKIAHSLVNNIIPWIQVGR